MGYTSGSRCPRQQRRSKAAAVTTCNIQSAHVSGATAGAQSTSAAADLISSIVTAAGLTTGVTVCVHSSMAMSHLDSCHDLHLGLLRDD